MPLRKVHAYLYNPDYIKNQINTSHRMEVKTLLIFRIIVLIYMTIVMVQTNVTVDDFMQNFLFMTLWGAYISYAYFIFAVIENISFLSNNKNQFFADSLWQLTHILFTLAFCLELPIFLMFWGYIYPRVTIPTTTNLIYNINVHGGIFLCILIDEFINDIQFVTRHVHVLAVVGLTYGLVNFSYVIASGNVIYPGITWDNYISYITICLTFLITLLSFWLGHTFYEHIKREKISSNEQTLLSTEDQSPQQIQKY